MMNMSEAAQILDPDPNPVPMPAPMPMPVPADNTPEPIKNAAREAEVWEVQHRPANKGSFPARVEARRNELKQLEADLARLPISPSAAPQPIPFHSELLDLRANPRMLRTAVSAVSDRPSLVARLPRVVSGQKDEPRVAAIAAAYLHAVDGVFSGPALSAFIRKLQVREPLTVDELWYVAPFLKFAL